MAAIDAAALTKRYGSTTAVDELDLAVPEGVVYGFLGPNGAGKTTTMRMLTALTRPTSGTASVAGAPVTDRQRLIERIGYLPEEPPLYDELTAREQLTYVAGLRDLPADRTEERIETQLDRLDLLDDADTRIDAYSKGMRQKTAFVQALLHDPDVLFLDEPTAGLDPRAARRMRESMVEFADGGATVFLSTHILPVVEAVADTVGVLFDGRVVAEGPTDSVRSRAEGEGGSLEDAFLAVTGGREGAPPADGGESGSEDPAARR